MIPGSSQGQGPDDQGSAPGMNSLQVDAMGSPMMNRMEGGGEPEAERNAGTAGTVPLKACCSNKIQLWSTYQIASCEELRVSSSSQGSTLQKWDCHAPPLFALDKNIPRLFSISFISSEGGCWLTRVTNTYCKKTTAKLAKHPKSKRQCFRQNAMRKKARHHCDKETDMSNCEVPKRSIFLTPVTTGCASSNRQSVDPRVSSPAQAIDKSPEKKK